MIARFAIATRDELWIRGRLLDRRLSHGEALQQADAIRASDTADAALMAACNTAMETLRDCILDDARVRLIAEASTDGVTATVTVTMNNRSVVTTREHFTQDVALLRAAIAPAQTELPRRALPLLWKNGSAAVLLHEAVGHPLEHGHSHTELPPWLSVDVSLRPRRASFKDVPLLRMSELVARQHDAPFEVPEEWVDVLLVDGGAYEPLSGTVTLRIAAADFVSGGEVRRVAPFTIIESRESIVRAIVGASGEPIRYPGVVCSREGQELVVGSRAPLVLTELR